MKANETVNQPINELTAPDGRHWVPVPLGELHGDDTHLMETGTWKALQVKGFPVGPDDTGADGRPILGPDGHLWALNSVDPMFWEVGRPRTASEQEAFIDRTNARIIPSYFSKDRLVALARIQRVIEEISESPIPRSGRRIVKHKLNVLSDAMYLLIWQRNLDMAMIRSLLATVGLVIPVKAHWS